MAHERRTGEGVGTSDSAITTGINFLTYMFPYLPTYLLTYLLTYLFT